MREHTQITDEMVEVATQTLWDSAGIICASSHVRKALEAAFQIPSSDTPPPSSHVLPIELDGVSRVLENKDGFWQSCTGCHELNEGVPTGPYSRVLKCHLGMGCSECGGIGAIWDTTDYEEMGRYLAGAADARIAFGLEAQGHIPAVEAALAEGADWQEIGRRIGWDGQTAKTYYERHLARLATTEGKP